MLEEKETQETSLKDLIDLVERDDLPTNEFTIEDQDPMVILGKLNEVIAYLQTLQATINSSDSKANEALQKAIQAVADATQALSVANGIDAKATQALANAVEAVSTANSALSASNTALNTANTAISTANSALSSANNAVETAEDALGTASRAENKADTAITTANGAKGTAEGIDAKATTALENSQTAISTANTANSKAQEALDQVVTGLGTRVYRDTALLSTLDIKSIEDNIADNATAITNLSNNKVDKVTGKQLSTEDFTTAEKNKLAGLNNYDDTQVKADITALQERATNIETKNTEQDTAIETLDNSKVDKVTGKGLSTEDYTTAEKTKLARALLTPITSLSDPFEIVAVDKTKLQVMIKLGNDFVVNNGDTIIVNKSQFLPTITTTTNASVNIGTLTDTILIKTPNYNGGTLYEFSCLLKYSPTSYTTITLTLPSEMQNIPTSKLAVSASGGLDWVNWERVNAVAITKYLGYVDVSIADDSGREHTIHITIKGFN